MRPARERHHLDGDVWNNTRANVRFLCVGHHRIEERRTVALRRARAGQLAIALPAEQLELA